MGGDQRSLPVLHRHSRHPELKKKKHTEGRREGVEGVLCALRRPVMNVYRRDRYPAETDQREQRYRGI